MSRRNAGMRISNISRDAGGKEEERKSCSGDDESGSGDDDDSGSGGGSGSAETALPQVAVAPSPAGLLCSCGAFFRTRGRLAEHQRTCRTSKE